MKKYILLGIAVFSCWILSIQAQDQIITNEGDTLNCRITKVDADYIYFDFMDENKLRGTLIDRSDVRDFQYDYYSLSEIPEGKFTGIQQFSKFRLALGGGFSYQTARLSPDIPYVLEDYTKELRSGFNFGGSGTFFISENIGIGADFNWFKTSNRIDGITVTDASGNQATGVVMDDVTLTYIGPVLTTRMLNARKTNAFLSHFGIGYLGYFNDGILIQELDLRGSTVGLSLGLGYDIGLSDHVAIGLNVSYIIGALSEITYEMGNITETVDLDEDQMENISRLDFSIGISFR